MEQLLQTISKERKLLKHIMLLYNSGHI